MRPAEIIGIAGFFLGVPSALVAVGDLKARRIRRSPDPLRQASSSARLHPILLSRPRRLLSSVVDTYAIMLSSVLAAIVVVPVDAPQDDADAVLGLFLIAAALGLAVWNAKTGRSLGKLLVGGRVVRHADHAPISFAQSLTRAACHLIPFGYWMMLGRQRRTAADHITATTVISTR